MTYVCVDTLNLMFLYYIGNISEALIVNNLIASTKLALFITIIFELFAVAFSFKNLIIRERVLVPHYISLKRRVC